MKKEKIKYWLQHGREVLNNSSSASLDAEILLAHILNVSRSYLYSHDDELVSTEIAQSFLDLLHRRQQGEPIAYLIGYKEFWNLKLKVTPATLIPRPETELIVETVMSRFANASSLHVLDLGTGSGAIAITLAVEHPQWKITATDISEAALTVVQHNAQHYQCKNISFRQSDWFQTFDQDERFDIIISNPPYLADQDSHLNQLLPHEPVLALTSGSEGMTALQTIITDSKSFLNTNGWLFIEHGYRQGEKVRTLMQTQAYVNIQTLHDGQGHERITCGRK